MVSPLFFRVYAQRLDRIITIMNNTMAEFLTESEASDKYGSKAKANAGLTLGIIGTALAALGWGNGSSILGMGGNSRPGSFGAGFGTGLVGAEVLGGMYGPTPWQASQQETHDQEYDLVRMGQLEVDSLKTAMQTRETDTAEKIALYRQTLDDNKDLQAQIEKNHDFTTEALFDLYKSGVSETRNLEQRLAADQLENYKNVSDLYTRTVASEKDIQLQIEKNRETDQTEKFGLYKDLSGQTQALAFQTMKQSYEDRLESLGQLNALSARVCQLEKENAVTQAQLPLMFQLQNSQTSNVISTATSRKIDGNLTLSYGQIQSPVPPQSISALYAAPFGPYPIVQSGGCTGTTTV